MPTRVPPVSPDDLTEHRLKVLEDLGVGSRETERRVDGLALTVAQIEKTVTETQTEMRTRDVQTHASLARLHQRLDAITTAESFEEGRLAGEKSAWAKTWKVVGWTVMATIAFGALVVGVLTLVLR